MEDRHEPEIIENPQVYGLEGSSRGMIIHSLGYIGLGPEAGQGVETSYHVTYFPGKATLCTRRSTADPSLPERMLVPAGTAPSISHLRAYESQGSYHGVWLEGYAAGQLLDTEFVFAERPQIEKPQRKGFAAFLHRVDSMISKFVRVENGMSVEDRRVRFERALQRMNDLVKQRAIEDLRKQDSGEDYPKAA